MASSNVKINFIQPTKASALYFAVTDPANRNAASHTFAFLPETATSAPISLAQSWQIQGTYVFLGDAIWDLTGFTQALQKRRQLQKNVRFIWIPNPNDESEAWQMSFIDLADGSGTKAGINSLKIGFRNLSLKAGKGCFVTLNEEQNEISIHPPADDPSQLTLTTQSGQAVKTIGALASALRLPLLDLSAAGYLLYSLQLNETDLETLDVGLRFFTDTAGAGNNPPVLSSQRYPLFNLRQSPLTLHHHLDPCRYDDSGHNYFSFTDGASSSPPKIVSYYLTTMGHPLNLTPQPSARLVFAVKPSAHTANPADPVYWVAEGEFAVSFNSSSVSGSAKQILCGLSGLEYLGLPVGNLSVGLHFIPNQNAFAADSPTANSNPDAPRLTGAATTAWLYFEAEPLTYFAQAEGAALYQKKTDCEFLNFMDIPLGILPVSMGEARDNNNAAHFAYPMAPYAGLSSASQNELDNYRSFEFKVLNPERRNRINQIIHANAIPSSIHTVRRLKLTASAKSAAMPPASSPANFATTPQGLLASFSPDLKTWETLTLARDANGNQLTLTRIDNQLKAALQTNQQFLVISDPARLTDSIKDNLFNVAGWVFDFDPEHWAEHGTVIIFKFYAGQSIKALVEDTSLWANPGYFNKDPAATQKNLQGYLESALIQFPKSSRPGTQTNSNYEYFVNSVTDDQWNGILILNSRLLITSLPQALEGLAAGIDPDKLYAHHLGINITPVKPTTSGRLEMGASAFFGLIDYKNESAAPADTYDYQVESMTVQIQNSQITGMSCAIKLAVGELFSTSVKLADGMQWLSLQGSYESHNGHGLCTFVGTEHRLFTLDSRVLGTVEITKVQLVTVVPKFGLQPDAPVHNRFILEGNLSFKPQVDDKDQLDLLSYDKLPFSNLVIDMMLDSGNQSGSKSFSLDASQLRISAADSSTRDNSLARQFPLNANGFMIGTDSLPTDQGYLAVKTPKLLGGLHDLWYGVTFELNLGNLGALAPQGSFSATLLVAWSPEQQSSDDDTTSGGKRQLTNASYPMAVAIKLPFASGGKKELSLQSILKLAIGSIELSKDDKTYLLALKKIALKFLILSLPPNSSTDLYLFGNPDTKNPVLAWYGAYVKNSS